MTAPEPDKAAGLDAVPTGDAANDEAGDRPQAQDDAEAPDQLAGDVATASTETAQQGQDDNIDERERSRTNEVLRTAARDVRVLISYVARRAPEKLTQEDSDPTIADKIRRGSYETADEIALWAQLARLTAICKPATAESILESRYYRVIFGKEGQQAGPGWVLSMVRLGAVVGFLLAVLLAAYVQVTTTGLETLTKALAERANIIEGNYGETRLSGLMSSQPEQDATAEAAVRSQGAKDATQQGGADEDGVDTADENQTDGSDQNSNGSPGADIQQPDRIYGLVLAKESLETEIRGGFSLLSVASLFAGPVVEMRDGVPTAIRGADGNFYVVYNHATLGAQRSINATLGDFVLPMLASFLGVAVFIIRDTSMRLESVSLSPMDEDGYLPRVILGLIAGLTIGWLTPSVVPFITTFSNGVVETSAASAEGVTATSLTKTALAFVAGYSVEVLFNVLDAIKRALGVQDDKTG